MKIRLLVFQIGKLDYLSNVVNIEQVNKNRSLALTDARHGLVITKYKKKINLKKWKQENAFFCAEMKIRNEFFTNAVKLDCSMLFEQNVIFKLGVLFVLIKIIDMIDFPCLWRYGHVSKEGLTILDNITEN